MEIVTLLLLLALSDKNGDLKQSVKQFLSLYQEHRELVQMLASMLSSSATESVNADIPPMKEEKVHEESRPQEKVGNLNLLEEYLRRAFAQ